MKVGPRDAWRLDHVDDPDFPRWKPYAPDDIVRAIRHRIVHEQLGELLRARAAHGFRSLAFTVAQFWNDEADDEVHPEYIASRELTPLLPHRCGGADVCQWCRREDAWPKWKHELTPTFEAYCREREPENPYDGISDHRVIAIARLAGDAVELEVVGRLVRPWLDLPNQPAEQRPLPRRIAELAAALRDQPPGHLMLADALQDLGDPRGELITGGIAYDERIARSWLGAFEPHVPRAAVRFANALPVEIGVWIDPAEVTSLDLGDPLPWAFAPALRFLPTSARPLSAAMASARALGPIEPHALAAVGVPFLCKELEVEIASPHELVPLEHVQLPNLERLRIVGAGAVNAWSWLRRWSRSPRHLELACAFEDAAAHAGLVERLRSEAAPITISMFDTDARVAAGWAVELDEGATVAVHHRGYHPGATPEWLDQLWLR